ncbi:MAG: acetate--CoA ligase family protein [Deltaproteobacteria bacterium]|jgi:acetate---CoA ligase (ADP-forming) subunit beta|nr:acetate--CoA ligase family protein [Deltaproteobacteria bacterium]MBT4641654.1 acetate--CoA ligase family protein [Deltaproteobacteria bacterium]MBT6504516.1 acetate--CoA ligase family protein [Deltaproteobacteria bacterium]MBT7152666.1 acetate--CoA ligase family protein [Deltaproteobacteria bacterium]MBT7716366.1 acetate--CoA ligase family protein [Deltaproteobacteria bacterium]
MEIIKQALKAGQTTLSEYDSKKVLAEYKIPVTKEIVAKDINELNQAAEKIGFPLVLKGSSSEIAHKTEKGLIKIDIRTLEEATGAFEEIIAKMGGDKGGVLVQEMIKGQRELVIGLTRDPQFGPCVMFGLGGIFTEILKDVAFRVAPLTRKDAMDIMEDIKSRKILDAVRGMEAVDREVLADILIAVGQIGMDYDEVQEIDINPLKIRDGKPVAVDALLVLKP